VGILPLEYQPHKGGKVKVSDNGIDGKGTMLLSRNDFVLDLTDLNTTEEYTVKNLTAHGQVGRHKMSAIMCAVCFVHGWDIGTPRKAKNILVLLLMYAIFAMQIGLSISAVQRGSWPLAVVAGVGFFSAAVSVAIVTSRINKG
jgi:hypothetical protein